MINLIITEVKFYIRKIRKTDNLLRKNKKKGENITKQAELFTTKLIRLA